MKAIAIREPGGPEVLEIIERDKPTPAKGQVLIKVHAAGINRPDVFQRQGSYPPPEGASDLPGLEVAGEIVDGDLSGTDLQIGDAVVALTPGGGYAEYCLAPAAHCLPKPERLSFEEAAGLPETCFTVWSNVFMRGRLAEEESLLVHGGASGIGTTAIQIAKALGHTVYATAGSDERVQALRDLGVDHGINYKTQDFVAEIKQLSQGQGVDVILDMVAGDYTSRNIKCAARNGRIVVIATLGGRMSEVDMALLMVKGVVLTGSTLRPQSIDYKAEVASQLHQQVWPLIEQGKFSPRIHQVFDYKAVQDAHAMMDAGQQIGKLILRFV
ncbi:NAD(P)H-quinone oxidoreductase [Brackiella oedipodis]|uniref:NAD(P)H-quinone oxidoreductase n=1 Tax=Brackiella oedipodis TaxID=124225 RepID=UPI000490F669|nr:NAD(P)H-quinone oxidoreductase [Brackiella oedipodis]